MLPSQFGAGRNVRFGDSRIRARDAGLARLRAEQKSIPKGVTLPTRATLEYNGVRHDAAVQTVNIAKVSYQSARGTELNFKDFWGYNVAGYELAKILELDMVPPYIERKVGGQSASLSWWVNDSMMELDRKNRRMEPRPRATDPAG